MASIPPKTPDEEARIESARAALAQFKIDSRLSWDALGDMVGRAGSTLSLFCTGKYEGRGLPIAEQIEKFFAAKAAEREMGLGAVRVPGFVETPFAADMMATLRFAQSGEIVAIACAPGLGKTETARAYRAAGVNVWLATMTRSTSRMQPMQIAVLKAMGVSTPKGTPQQLSAEIMAKMANARGLLIIDEFHELGEDAVEEIRSWHDATGVGMAFIGDYRVIATIEGRRDRREKAQIFSRLSKRLVRHQASGLDAATLLDAWGITDEASRRFAAGVAVKQGGLRSMTKMLKLAHFAGDGSGTVSLADLRAARAQLTSALDA